MGLSKFPGFDDAMRLRLAGAADRLTDEFEGLYETETPVVEWSTHPLES